ncbi:MAG: hypothetical protein A2X64_09095 [Ignavibacteria bacterium GWF2_33_9]|nr:MAG: hypothetical protein A2X64_09095 [Ignavibacteria bacterium GWF2_33_9]
MNCLEGSGEIVKTDRKLPHFDSIYLNGGFDLYLIQSDTQKVEVEIDDNLDKYIRTAVNNNELEIIETKSVCTKIKRIHLYTPNLKKIRINGATDIIGKTPISFNYLEINASGASSMRMEEFNCENLKIDLSGAADIRINKGRGGNLLIRASGATDIKMKDFFADSCKVEISGAGDITLSAETFLLVKVFGAGDVKYKSSKDTKVVKKIMGAGSVTKIE